MSDTVIYTKIPRVKPDVIESLRGIGVADLHEAMGPTKGRQGLMSPDMRPLIADAQIVGQAVTGYNYPGDNLMIHCALYYAQAGDVLVLTNGGDNQGALWGEVAATQAKLKGVEGIVISGATRDTSALREMGSKVWATAISVCHPDKKSAGAVNIPVVCDGVLVNPGDIIVADNDGVLVIPPAEAEGVAQRARARMAKEIDIRAALAKGEKLFDILNMSAAVQAVGGVTHDKTWKDN